MGQVFRRRNLFLSKLWTALYPPRMAPIGLKLQENAFQVIPDISFFDGTNTFCDQNLCCKTFFLQRSENFFSKVPVLEELCRFTHQCRMQLENSLPELSVSAFYDPWRRGKKRKNCFCREFWPKTTYTFSAMQVLAWRRAAMQGIRQYASIAPIAPRPRSAGDRNHWLQSVIAEKKKRHPIGALCRGYRTPWFFGHGFSRKWFRANVFTKMCFRGKNWG